MKISAIVVTYNRLNLLKQCLKHLLKLDYDLNNIVVVNNNSSDGTKSYLENLNNKKIISVTSSKNLGGAGGFSLGTDIAYEKTDSDYFWLMDDDTMPTCDSLTKLVDKAKELKYNFGFLCSNVRWWKNYSVTYANIPVPSVDWNDPILNDLVKVQSCSFVAVLFSRKIVQEVGLPIASMFIWGDDVEFTNRLSHENSRCYLVTNSNVMHKSGANKPYNITTNPRANFYKYQIRNTMYVNRKYHRYHDIVKQFMSLIFNFFKIPFKAKNQRIERMKCILVGSFKGIFFKPRIYFPNKKFIKKYCRTFYNNNF